MLFKSSNIFLLLLLILFSCGNKYKPKTDSADLFVALPTPPIKVTNTEGTWLVYELHLKSPTLQKVEIFDSEALLQTYDAFNTRKDLHLASIWLEFPALGWKNQELIHKFYFRDSAGNSKQNTFKLKLEKQYPNPITITFPVPHGIWLAEAAPGKNSYHTRAIFPFKEPLFDSKQQGYLIGNNPQRYAIDYAMLVDGRPHKNDGKKLEDWYCYNLPILASEGGKVIFTENNIPDNMIPGEIDYKITASNITGNVVYIEHGDGSIATYCHLIPNSIVVKTGDIVTTGQELGRLGNSGNSSAPHLHFHLLTNPEGKTLNEYADGLYMESLPYKFSRFTKLGKLPTSYLDERPLKKFIPTISEVFNNALPSENDVIEF